MPTETADWVGLTLDRRYTVTAKLGEGGMGFVYRARDVRLDCDVVVKVPRAAMLEDAGFRQRFKDEVSALVKLAHPHVVKVTDFGQHDGVPFAVMQFLPGGSLEDCRPKNAAGHFKALSSKSLNQWLLPVAEALDFIHKQGYVHRDVKPPNILFDAYKNAYISDFGVAKVVAGNKAAGAGVTGTGMILGTPTYMAPELVLGSTFDGKIDQYALAITVFELLAGRPPFDEPTPMATLVKRTTEEPPALAEARPGTGSALSTAVAKALSRDPAQRYPTCAAFAKAVLAAAARTSNAPAAHVPGSPARETPRSGVPHTTAEGYGIIGAIPPSMAKRSSAAVVPVASIVEDEGPGIRKTPPRVPTAGSGRKTALIVGLTAVATTLATLLGVGIWQATANGGRQPSGPVTPSASVGANDSTPKNPSPKKQIVDTPRLPVVTDLRPNPAAIELVAGGPWVPIDISVERSGSGPVKVELAPLIGVDVKQSSVVVEAEEPAHFELRAAGTGSIRGLTAHFSVRGTSVRRTVPITFKRLEFQAHLASPGDITLSPGQEKAVEINIDRSGGYNGPLTITVPGSGTVTAATVPVPADAKTATVPISAPANARPGGITVRIAVVADEVGAKREVPVLVYVSPVAELRAFNGHTGKVNCAALSPDSKLALSGGADGSVRLWDVATGEQKWKVDAHPGGVLSVVFAADGQRAMSGGTDHEVRLYDVVSGKDTACEKIHAEEVWLVRFVDGIPTSLSGDKLAKWENDGRVRTKVTRDAITKVVVKRTPETQPGHRLQATTRVPSDDGEYFLSGVQTPSVSLWKRAPNATPPQKVASRTPPQGGTPVRIMTLSGDSKRILTIGDGKIVRLWDATTPLARAIAGFPWTPDAEVTCAALDGSGGQALLGGPDGMLKLWRLP